MDADELQDPFRRLQNGLPGQAGLRGCAVERHSFSSRLPVSLLLAAVFRLQRVRAAMIEVALLMDGDKLDDAGPEP
jgi:hypothetical protein